MTSLAEPTTTAAPGSAAAWAGAVRQWLPDVAVVAVLGWWATYLTWGTGGREPHLLGVGCLLTAAAWCGVRPDRLLPGRLVLLGLSPGLGAVAVVASSPTGWAGRDDAAAWVWATATGVVLLAWAGDAARGGVRRTLLLVALVAAGGAQFAAGWLPWWGAQDPQKLFQGTFYWHNQVGVFLAATGLLALAAVAHGRAVGLLGWAVAPLCVAGTVFSTSRGSQLGLGLGIVLLVALVGDRRAGPRLAVLGATALGGAASVVLTGPPFFPERVSPVAGTAARSESFVGNGVTRLEDWAAAWEVFARWPVTGAGFDSFRAATEAVGVGERSGMTAYVHNGFLQALTDGGLLLGVPLLAVTVALAAAVLRRLPAAVRGGDAVAVGAAVVLLVLALHSGMDFDWAYPSLLGLPALVAPLVVGPLVVGPPTTATPPSPGRSPAWWSVPVVALLLVSAACAWHGGLALNAPLG